jgi:DNA polymerase I-like protein with 3'-5' exonuclease and polymerase domains
MPIIETDLVDMSSCGTSIYNGYDCLLTYEIWEKLRKKICGSDTIADARHIYNFERALQAPVMAMQLNGIKVNPFSREDGICEIKSKLRHISDVIDKFANALGLVTIIKASPSIHAKPKFLNPASSLQLQNLFYNCLALTPVVKWVDGKETLPMDDDALEKLEDYFIARPIINAIRKYRELVKQLEVMDTSIDNDLRMRASFSIAGTDTWRFSSSKSIIGNGRNLQNIDPELRYIFEADEGFNLYAIDLEQAESREVGLLTGVLFDDWRYLDACEAGDLHSTVASMTWINLPWNHEKKHDRKIADEIFHGKFTRRDTCKRLGHGCLTEDHEVLTPDGWIPIWQKPNIIMQWNEDKFVKVSRWTEVKYVGDMYNIHGKDISQNVTEEHRLYCYMVGTEPSLEIITAKELYNKYYKEYYIPIIAKYSTNDYVISKSLCMTDVFCPTVPSGAFYVRRNGKISVTGNSNYYGKPTTMSRETKIPVDLVTDFQLAYFTAFPAIPKWHEYVRYKLQSQQRLTNAFGATRYFFDRPNEDSTLRSAIASQPQSATAMRLNLGMYRLWKDYPEAKLLLQVHDAIYFEVSEKRDPREVRDKALKLIEITQDINGRKFIIPGECKYGKNWGYQVTEDSVNDAIANGNKPPKLNINGLRKIKE